MRRLAVVRLSYAANSFSPVVADAGHFERHEWLAGPAAIAAARESGTELAALDIFRLARPDWQVNVLRCAAAPPMGPMDDDLFTRFYDEVMAGIAGGGWDAVYLALHGAALTTRRVRPELSLLAAIRNEIGSAKLGASFDMHANLAPELVRYLTFASCHRTVPRLDRRDTAYRVLDQLATAAEGRLNPVGAVVKASALLPPDDLATLNAAEQVARAAENDSVLDVSASLGFAQGDTPDGGAAAMAFADGDPEAARRAATAVAAALRDRRAGVPRAFLTPAAGITAALAGPPGLVCVADRGDAIGAGGIGDTPELLRALVAMRPAVPSVFAALWDPPLVARARAAGIGAVLDAALGGRVLEAYGPPVQARATVTRLGDAGCVLDVEGIAVIVSEANEPAFDAAFFVRHGLDLAATRLLCVKAGQDIRATLGEQATLVVEVEAPGPTSGDLSCLPYRRLPLDLLPLSRG